MGKQNWGWELDPSFTRIANDRKLNIAQALQLESEAVVTFAKSASGLLPIERTMALSLARFKSDDGRQIDFLGWMAVMQHFCAPTRILDWSISPWVGLYFACVEQNDVNGELFIADYRKVTDYRKAQVDDKTFVKMLNKESELDVLDFITPENTNERIEAQQSRFSICTNPLADHRRILEEAKAVLSIEIPHDLKPIILEKLNQMNITAKSLFPGIDGLGRSIAEYCNLWDPSSITT